MKFIICFIVSVCVFCKNQDHKTIEIKLSPLGLPLLMLCNKYQLLIDTGSQEVWMADKSCLNCIKTIQLCPHINSISNKIEYFQGEVLGDMTYINTCIGSHKVFCVKQSKGMESLQAVGILGIKGNSTGKKLIMSMLENMKLETSSLSFYFGTHEAKCLLGHIPKKYFKSELAVKKIQQLQWHIALFAVKINQQSEIKFKSSVFFDTGSNILALPKAIYHQVINPIKQIMLSKKCILHQSQTEFECYNYINLNDSYIKFRISSDYKDPLIQLKLTDLIQVKNRIYSLLIRQNSKNTVLIGVSVFKEYIVQYSMDGSIRLFRNNIEELGAIQLSNYITAIFEYIIILCLLSVAATKIHQIIEETINRKIVI